MKSGIELIAEERQRQIQEEGWTKEHDAEHAIGELAMAASCYAMIPEYRPEKMAPLGWPWDDLWWKPSFVRTSDGAFVQPKHLRVRELQKAGALIAAEIDRLNASDEAVS